MRNNLLRIAGLGVCLLAWTTAAQAGEKIVWVNSFTKALAQAKSTHKLMVIDFYTDWCGWCKKLDSDTYTDKKVVAQMNDFIPVKLDAEKEGLAAAKKYKVSGFPTIMFINEAGEAEGKIVGYLPPAGFSQKLTQIAQMHKDLPTLEAKYKANPNDNETAGKLAKIYAGRGDLTRAADLLAAVEKNDPQDAKGIIAPIHNAIGDGYQEQGEFDKAIPHFKKAVETGKKPDDIAYAHISIAVCYLSQNDFKNGKSELQATIDTPGCPEETKKQAQEYLAQVNKIEQQKKPSQ